MADRLIMVGVNLLLSAALWGLGMLFRKSSDSIQGDDVKNREIQVSSYGEPKPILYGQCKTAMSLIYADNLRKTIVGDHAYYLATFAGLWGIAPEVDVFGNVQLLKMYCDDKLIYNITDDEKVIKQSKWVAKKFRFYNGTQTVADPSLEDKLGTDNVPAYKNKVYGCIHDLNVINYSNRIPTMRAIVGPATFAYQEADLVNVPGYPGDGYNRDRYYSLQILMSPDETFIICHDWDYINDGIWFYKISTFTNQLISSIFMELLPPYEEYYCDGQWASGNYTFGWHHPACVDERGKVYACGCMGLGRFYRLNSDTWEEEARSPMHPMEDYEEINPGWYGTWVYGHVAGASYYWFKLSRVSYNPSFPYVWFNTASSEMGRTGAQGVALVNRNTMANPYDSSHWGHYIHSPRGCQPDPDPGYSVPWAFCLDNTTGCCYIFWSDAYHDPPECWLTRFDPKTASRLDVKIYPGVFGWDSSGPCAHMGYDSDTGTLVLQDQKYLAPNTWESYIYFWDSDLNYTGKMTIPDELQPGNYGEDNYVRIVGSKFYTGNFYGSRMSDKVRIYEIDIAKRSYRIVFEVPYDSNNLWMIDQAVFCSYKFSLYCEVEYDYYVMPDTRLKELSLGKLTPDTVYLDDITRDILLRSGFTDSQINVTNLAGIPVKGYCVVQDQSAREALEPLMEAFIFDFAEIDGVLVAIRRGGAVAATIPEEDISAFMFNSERPDGIEIEGKDEVGELPRRVEVHYLDVDRKHDEGVQHYSRQLTDSKNNRKLQTPVLFDNDDAKQLAHISFKYDWISKPCTISFGPKWARLAPCDVVMVETSGGNYRILLMEAERQGLLTRWRGVVEGFNLTTDLYDSDISGIPLPEIDDDVAIPAVPVYYFLNTPPLLDSHDYAAVYVASGAVFGDWAGCSLWVSKDTGLSWNYFKGVPNRAITGTLLTALDDHDYVVRDYHSSVDVRWDYEGDSISGVTESQLLQGQGSYLAVIKSNEDVEIICVKNVTTNEDGTQTLSNFIRGCKGTEYATTGHSAGEKVVKLSTSYIVVAELDVTYLNQSYLYNGVGIGDDFDDGVKRIYLTGLNTLKPWSGAQPRGARDGSSNLTITWYRRNRLYGTAELFGGTEIPMSETSESYEVDILDGSGDVVRTIDGLSTELASYSAAEQTADGLTPGDPVDCNIYQLSSVVGRGWPLEATV